MKCYIGIISVRLRIILCALIYTNNGPTKTEVFFSDGRFTFLRLVTCHRDRMLDMMAQNFYVDIQEFFYRRHTKREIDVPIRKFSTTSTAFLLLVLFYR